MACTRGLGIMLKIFKINTLQNRRMLPAEAEARWPMRLEIL